MIKISHVQSIEFERESPRTVYAIKRMRVRGPAGLLPVPANAINMGADNIIRLAVDNQDAVIDPKHAAAMLTDRFHVV